MSLDKAGAVQCSLSAGTAERHAHGTVSAPAAPAPSKGVPACPSGDYPPPQHIKTETNTLLLVLWQRLNGIWATSFPISPIFFLTSEGSRKCHAYNNYKHQAGVTDGCDTEESALILRWSSLTRLNVLHAVWFSGASAAASRFIPPRFPLPLNILNLTTWILRC